MSTRVPCRRWAVVGLALVWLASTACAPGARPAAPPGPASSGGERAPAAGAAAAGGQQVGAAAPSAPAVDPFTVARTMPLEELHQRALAEGGTFHFYATLAPAAAEKVFRAFEARFPGIKVDQVDATGDRLMARIVSESRGGKTLADAFSGTLNFVQPLNQQGFFAQFLPDEALALPEDLRGPYWFTTNQQFVVAAYNTERVRPDEIPRQYEDLGDPRWKDRLMLDPSDVELLMGLARKYGSDDQAADVLRRIAANNPAIHRGHSELAELLAAGQGDVCLTCFADHILARVRRGAPLDYMRSEGVSQLSGSAVMKDAPHPYTAMLWQRWAASEEGQQAYADGGRTPGHPVVLQRLESRVDKVYAVSADEMLQMRRHEGTWKAIFQLR